MRAERHARLVGVDERGRRRRTAAPRPVERRRTQRACEVPAAEMNQSLHRRAGGTRHGRRRDAAPVDVVPGRRAGGVPERPRARGLATRVPGRRGSACSASVNDVCARPDASPSTSSRCRCGPRSTDDRSHDPSHLIGQAKFQKTRRRARMHSPRASDQRSRDRRGEDDRRAGRPRHRPHRPRSSS